MRAARAAGLLLLSTVALGCGAGGDADPSGAGGSSGGSSGGAPGGAGGASDSGGALGGGTGGTGGVLGLGGSIGGAPGVAGSPGRGGDAGSAATGGTPGRGGAGGAAAGAPGRGGTGGSAGAAGAPGRGGAGGSAGAAGRGGTGGGASTCALSGAAGPQTPTVYVIGDSTASIYASNLYPRMGWAQPLQDYFAPACATIQDKALSGRSAKSFYNEGAWTPIKTALRAGDYVLIQFGHNDEKSDEPTLFTDPRTTYQQYLSIYIDDARAKGATPILLTSINRNKWSAGKLQDTHGDYPPAMRQLAQTKQVALVDATLLTKTYFERIGQTATTMLFMDLAPGQFPNYPSGNDDDTHLQETGARIVARIVLADLHRQGLPPGTLAKTVPQAP